MYGTYSEQNSSSHGLLREAAPGRRHHDMTSIALKFRSTAPLIMHSARLSDPLDPIAIELAAYHEKAKLSPADHLAIGAFEFSGGLWTCEDRPCVPARTIEAALHQAAHGRALAARVIKAISVIEDALLLYPGPQRVAALLNDPQFRLRQPANVDGRRRMRTRPIFPVWEITAIVHYDPALVGRDIVTDLAITAGDSIGIGAGRPRYGTFSVSPVLDHAG